MTLWNTNTKCQPSHCPNSPALSVSVGLQGVNYRFARVNPYDLRIGLTQARAQAGEATDVFHRGRDEEGQQGHCDPLQNFPPCTENNGRHVYLEREICTYKDAVEGNKLSTQVYVQLLA